ncbi:hypothetical protein [Pseudoalteromonas viridis]|uniref:DUF4281 domain-containing protein n=1 Tax=Pseudoalteromonas viridis TaxID=339617 RepID=A0ABX7V3Q3_9GAMM|nr:hypothetical protein [Pseudoalteromonas viridis]QTL34072.1 hypothetical protein J5X90_10845 [Pseudoalteromonas viridis]
MAKLISLTLGSTHFCFVIYIAYLIATSSDSAAVNAWLLFIPMDFPISLGLFPISYLLDGNILLNPRDSNGIHSIFRDINNFWLPAIYFGVVGSLWWYFLPKLIVKFKNKLVPELKGNSQV